jgi:hypothetical protein
MPLRNISIGWRWLNNTLNGIIDEVNQNAPISSDTIALNQTSNGTVFRTVKGATQQSASNGGGGTAAYSTITLNDVAWQTVIVVDPNSCAQSTISVLANVPGQSVDLSIKLK